MLREQVRDWLEAMPLDGVAATAEERAVAVNRLCGAEFGWAAVESDLEATLWLAFARAHRWQPVRILLGQGRSRGFPERAVDIFKIRDWCQRSVRRGWAIENRTAVVSMAAPGITFWFEDGREAARFALKWLPMKCT